MHLKRIHIYYTKVCLYTLNTYTYITNKTYTLYLSILLTINIPIQLRNIPIIIPLNISIHNLYYTYISQSTNHGRSTSFVTLTILHKIYI